MKKLLAIGGGKSGLAALELGCNMNFKCFLYDDFPEKMNRETDEFLNTFNVELLKKNELKEMDFDTVVVSPGVPHNHKLVKSFIGKGMDVVSEIEFGFRFLKGRVIGITGSNGKTTTTAITGHIMETVTCGNYGYPFCKALLEQGFDGWYVVELSSFQLELIRDFCPDIACILNLSPDHLDRYGSTEDYYLAKFNIFKNMNKNQHFFANANDIETLNYRSYFPSFTEWIGENTKPFSVNEKGIFYERRLIVDPFDLKIRGLHNLYNAAFAIAMAYSAGVDIKKSVEKLKSFKPIEHRLEFVDVLNGVYFYNDSKATNFDSVKKALSSFENIRWIAGGIYKGGDFTDFFSFKKRIKKAYFIGESAPLFYENLKEFMECEISTEIDNAVRHAFREAEKGDVILLSPACSSFDQFASYEDRGRVFKSIVSRLKDEFR